ncbi:MAG: hypothetical protein RSB61_00060 [Clostridia bacterium]
MKRYSKIFLVLMLVFACLLSCAACTQKDDIHGEYVANNATYQGVQYDSISLKLDKKGGYELILAKKDVENVKVTGAYSFVKETDAITFDEAMKGENKFVVTAATKGRQLSLDGCVVSKDKDATPSDTLGIFWKGMLAIFLAMMVMFILVKTLNICSNHKFSFKSKKKKAAEQIEENAKKD